jgi:hypothetical protein
MLLSKGKGDGLEIVEVLVSILKSCGLVQNAE